MTYSAFLLFMLASAVAIATPGPTVLLALTNGSRYGMRAAGWGMAGAVLADLILVSTAAAGLGVVIAASEVAFRTLKWVGAAYLAYVGWKLLRAKPADLAASVAPAQDKDASARQLFMRSFLVAVTNPKALLFMSAFLPQFVNTNAALLPQYAAILLVLATLNVAAMLAYAALGARMVGKFRSGLHWINRVSGVTLIGLAAGLAVFRRSQT